MATKKSKSKKEDKLGKAKAIVQKINSDLIDASFNAIQTTVKTGEKWQKLTAKLVKKTEPLTKHQIKMVVDTAESIKGQLENSTERLKTLVGYDPKMMDNAKKMVTKNPFVEKAEEMKEKFEKQVSSNKLVKKAEKMSEKLKKNISSTIDEAKEKLEDYAEDALDSINEKLDKKAPQKAKKTKKATKKKVVKKEEITAEKEVIIAEEAQPKAEVLSETIQVPKTDVKDNLKVIKGVGPVLEKSLNDLNITAYDQIAKMTIEDLTNLLNGAGINAKIYDLAGWKAQATLALAGDMEAVKNWEKK
ncbi:MAG: putative flap endonuclease-1-like 5' DNA nuclease [Polaribacter sp.]|jgi:predicted flap endonuclease-1-like 5' DNA nuclease